MYLKTGYFSLLKIDLVFYFIFFFFGTTFKAHFYSAILLHIFAYYIDIYSYIEQIQLHTREGRGF